MKNMITGNFFAAVLITGMFAGDAVVWPQQLQLVGVIILAGALGAVAAVSAKAGLKTRPALRPVPVRAGRGKSR